MQEQKSKISTEQVSLYWIHLPEHTDFLTEGYIGITKNSPENRFTQHRANALRYQRKGRYLSPLKVALIEYPDKLLLKTLVIGSQKYIKDLEREIRPTIRIGWNLSRGGGTPEDIRVMGYGSEYHKSQLRKYLDENGHYAETRSPWLLASSIEGDSKSIWSVADIIYKIKDKTATSITKILGIEADRDGRNGSVRTIMKRIKSGWVPKEDTDWISFIDNNKEIRDLALQSVNFDVDVRSCAPLQEDELKKIYDVWREVLKTRRCGSVYLNSILREYSVNRLDTAIRKFKDGYIPRGFYE